MNKLDKEKLPYKYQDMINEPTKRKIYLVDVISTSKTVPQNDFLLLTQFVFYKYDLDLLLKAYPKSRYKEI